MQMLGGLSAAEHTLVASTADRLKLKCRAIQQTRVPIAAIATRKASINKEIHMFWKLLRTQVADASDSGAAAYPRTGCIRLPKLA